jgi:ribose 5-phosphate isomerase B
VKKVIIGSDHFGLPLRQDLAAFLAGQGYEVANLGPRDDSPVDFPDAATEVAAAVKREPGARGILICGTGIGVSIAANKIPGIRAALAHDHYSAHQSVEHDDANVLCLGSLIVGSPVARELAESFLEASLIEEDDYIRRVAKINDLEP